jgi:hypothetical protein
MLELHIVLPAGYPVQKTMWNGIVITLSLIHGHNEKVTAIGKLQTYCFSEVDLAIWLCLTMISRPHILPFEGEYMGLNNMI